MKRVAPIAQLLLIIITKLQQTGCVTGPYTQENWMYALCPTDLELVRKGFKDGVGKLFRHYSSGHSEVLNNKVPLDTCCAAQQLRNCMISIYNDNKAECRGDNCQKSYGNTLAWYSFPCQNLFWRCPGLRNKDTIVRKEGWMYKHCREDLKSVIKILSHHENDGLRLFIYGGQLNQEVELNKEICCALDRLFNCYNKKCSNADKECNKVSGSSLGGLFDMCKKGINHCGTGPEVEDLSDEGLMGSSCPNELKNLKEVAAQRETNSFRLFKDGVIVRDEDQAFTILHPETCCAIDRLINCMNAKKIVNFGRFGTRMRGFQGLYTLCKHGGVRCTSPHTDRRIPTREWMEGLCQTALTRLVEITTKREDHRFQLIKEGVLIRKEQQSFPMKHPQSCCAVKRLYNCILNKVVALDYRCKDRQLCTEKYDAILSGLFDFCKYKEADCDSGETKDDLIGDEKWMNSFCPVELNDLKMSSKRQGDDTFPMFRDGVIVRPEDQGFTLIHPETCCAIKRLINCMNVKAIDTDDTCRSDGECGVIFRTRMRGFTGFSTVCSLRGVQCKANTFAVIYPSEIWMHELCPAKLKDLKQIIIQREDNGFEFFANGAIVGKEEMFTHLHPKTCCAVNRLSTCMLNAIIDNDYRCMGRYQECNEKYEAFLRGVFHMCKPDETQCDGNDDLIDEPWMNEVCPREVEALKKLFTQHITDALRWFQHGVIKSKEAEAFKSLPAKACCAVEFLLICIDKRAVENDVACRGRYNKCKGKYETRLTALRGIAGICKLGGAGCSAAGSAHVSAVCIVLALLLYFL